MHVLFVCLYVCCQVALSLYGNEDIDNHAHDYLSNYSCKVWLLPPMGVSMRLGESVELFQLYIP